MYRFRPNRMFAPSVLSLCLFAAPLGLSSVAQAAPEWRTWGSGTPATANPAPASEPAQATPLAPATDPMSQGGMTGELLRRIQQLEAEVRDLRGQVEVQGNQMETMKRSQRQTLLDMEKRLERLEGGASASVQAPIVAPPAAPAPVTPPPVVAAPAPASSPAPVAAPIQAAPSPALSAAPATAGQADVERQAYDQAFALLKDGQYDVASKAFGEFVQKNPNSTYAANALYWQGEALYVQRNLKAALESFDQVLKRYPASAKAADALLKTGYIQYDLADFRKARETLSAVVNKYPGTQAAGLAEQRMKRMQQEGL